MGLGRDDLGRIAQGAKADLVLADLDHPAMQPVRDPLRSLVFSAAERAVRHVYVDGRRVVEDGEVLTVDQRSAAARLTEGQQRIMEDFPNLDWGHRSVDRALPLCLPRWDSTGNLR